MPTTNYRNHAGKRLPGTTTIVDRFKKADALIHWAWKLGMENKDYRKVREAAADVGTIAHELVDASIHKREPEIACYPRDQIAKARVAFSAFQDWSTTCRVEYVETEIHLVSEEHQFGGTPDAIGKVNGKLALLDWKTGNRLYADALLQLAAYQHLWEVNRPDEPLVGGFHLCRFDKETGSFQHIHFPELTEAWKAFKRMRELYEIMKTVEKMV